VIFVPYEDLAGVLGRDGEVNDIAVRLEPGADAEGVRADVAGLLSGYGPVRVTERADQISNRLLQLDLDGFRSLALVFPILFLTVSSLAIYSLLNRLVQTQRGQIGVMRAMGYTRGQMVRHYLAFGGVIGGAGSLAGMLLGFGLSVALTEAYAWFLHVPFVAIRFQPGVMAVALAAGMATALGASAATAWAAARVRPADAMRPPAPPAGRRTLLEVVIPPLARLPGVIKLPLRGIFRAPRRTVYTAFGVAAGVALTLVAASFLDSYNHAISVQFDRIQNYDARLNFTVPFPTTGLSQAGSLEGVDAVEPIVEAPVRLSAGGHSHDTLVRGLPAGGELYRVYTPSGEREQPGDGILLTEPVADILGVGAGDAVSVQPLTGTEEAMELRVDGIVQQPMGDIVFARLDTVQKAAGAGGMATALLFDFRGDEPAAGTQAGLLGLPGAANLEFTQDLHDYVNELSRLFLVFVVVMLAFGVALGLTIIFNTVTINVLERQRELATMRTLGMGIPRIGSMVTIENLLMGLLGAVVGMPIGYGLAVYFASLYQNELFDMPLVINDSTYGIAAVAAIITLVLAEIPAIRYIRGLDLPAVVREMAT
jgi:putative ABC transport system permease protein